VISLLARRESELTMINKNKPYTVINLISGPYKTPPKLRNEIIQAWLADAYDCGAWIIMGFSVALCAWLVLAALARVGG